MTLSFDTCKILIADDSKLVTTSISTILSQSGKNDIFYAFTPFEVINLCKQMRFDLIICDYNFQDSLNGFQLLEELQYKKLLPAHTTFIFLTGEDNSKVVRSIEDSDADDCLLKPLNYKIFLERIVAAMKRRSALLPIYQQLHEQNFESTVEVCTELLRIHPEYDILIRRYRALAMVKMKQFDCAQKEYEQLLLKHNFDWIKIALANTLIKIDELDKAEKILDQVADKTNAPYYHDEKSKIAVEKDDFSTAMQHLKQSIMLLDAGAERELVITNLSLANESYDDAVTYIRRYYEKNEHTFRGEVYTKLNFTRCYLYRALNNPLSNCFESLLFGLNPLITEINNDSRLKTHSVLISAHIALVRGDHSTANSCVKQALRSNDLTHFYDLYHLCVLLERCSFLDEMKRILPKTRAAISDTQHPSIRRSQIHMLKKLEIRLVEAEGRVDAIRKQLAEKKSTPRPGLATHFDHYFKLHDIFPHSQTICLAIVKLASLRPFIYQGEYRIFNKLDACDQVVTSSFSSEELFNMRYSHMYESARANIR